MATFTGTVGADSIVGGAEDDLISGLGGNDTLRGGLGKDSVDGGDGADFLFGDGGDDTLNGGNDNDSLEGGDGADTLFGGAGLNTLRGGAGDDQLNGGAGNDILDGGVGAGDFAWYEFITTAVTVNLSTSLATGAGIGTDSLINIENVTGSQAGDVITGSTLANTLNGSAGNDTVDGGAGDDLVLGGAGTDSVLGSDGNDVVYGDEPFAPNQTTTATGTTGGQPIAISLTGARWDPDATTSILGYVDNRPPSDARLNIVYVVDVSGSMNDPFVGNENVGDLNGDGRSNTLLDAAIAGYTSLNNSILAAGLGRVANISLVTFSSGATTVFNGLAATDNDRNGTADVVQFLRGLNASGGTNYEAGLQQAISNLSFSGGVGTNYVFFMSDGEPNAGGSYSDETATLLTTYNARVRAIGLGDSASLPALDLVDDGVSNGTAERVQTPSQLSTGLIEPSIDLSLIGRVEILLNGNLVKTILPGELVATPFGYRYSADLSGLSTTASDTVTARVVAAGTGVVVPTTITVVQQDATPGAADTVSGGNGNDRVDGNAGNDLVLGDAGDDSLSGGSGNDTLNGGAGSDTADFSAEFQNVFVSIPGNVATGIGVDTLISVENAIGGFGNDVMIGGLAATIPISTAITKPATTLNSSNATSINLDGAFGLQSNPNIFDATTVPHATVVASASGQVEVYRFTVNGPSTITLDIDATSSSFDSVVELRNATGTLLASNDQGAGDPGSTNGNDSSLAFNVTTAGVYYVTVREFFGSVIPVGTNYTLHVSVTNPVLSSTTQTIGSALEGGGGADTLIATVANGTLSGGEGNDVLWFKDGTFLDGGSGFDYAIALDGGGEVRNIGASGVEVYVGSAGVDNINAAGSNQNNIIYGGGGNDAVTMGAGGGYAFGMDGADNLLGGAGTDFLLGGVGTVDTLNGGAGNDILFIDNLDVFNGGSGIDYAILESTGGATFNLAGLGIEVFVGNVGNDVINAAGVPDAMGIYGFGGADFITGGNGASQLFGQDGNDTIQGGNSNDVILGGADADFINGGLGDDLILGEAGADTVLGSLGADTLWGGAGLDTFRFQTGDLSPGVQDIIADFADLPSDFDLINLVGISQSQYSAINVNGGVLINLQLTSGIAQIFVLGMTATGIQDNIVFG
jgi:Ca2+-binding RTX toxin-like protein